MKNIYFILFFGIFSFSLLAQPQLGSNVFTYRNSKDLNNANLYGLSSYSDGYVGILNIGLDKRNLNKDKQNTCLFQIDEDFTQMTQNWFTIPIEMDAIVRVFKCQNNLIGFYEQYDKSSKTESIYRQVIAKDGSFLSDLEKVFSVELEKRDNTLTYTASSEDRSKHAALFMFTDKKDKLMGIHTVLMDEQGEILWEENFLPNFAYAYFDIQDVILSNDGNLVIALNNYNKKGNNVLNEQVVILQMKDGQMEKSSISSPYLNITSMEAIFLDNENIMLAGYYTNAKRKNSSCIFTLPFALSTTDFGTFRDVDLTAKLASRLTFIKLPGSFLQIYTKGLEKLDNGQLVLLGEQRAVVTVMDAKTGQLSYVYHNGNILVHHINSEGEIVNNTTIEKYQRVATGSSFSIGFGNLWVPLSSYQKDPSILGISYNYFKQGNNVYVVYNDLAKNHLPGANKIKPYLGNYKASGTVLAKITPEEKITKSLINNYKLTKTVFSYVPFSDSRKGTAILAFKNNIKAFGKYEGAFRKLELE